MSEEKEIRDTLVESAMGTEIVEDVVVSEANANNFETESNEDLSFDMTATEVGNDPFAKPLATSAGVREALAAIPIPEFSIPDDTPDDGRTPIIHLDEVKVVFKTRTGSLLNPNKVVALKNSTIKLMPGETIGLVGESGCGKSTTANVMCGLQPVTEGKVYFNGKDVTKRTAEDRKTIGRVLSVVFQDPATALNARMSIQDQLLDPLNVHNIGTKAEREKRVLELLEMVGLPTSCLQALPGQMSGGQRQRVAIARALSLGPDAIIADEPTSALDVSVRAQILNLLTDLKKELNLAMVFISHDIQTIRYISDRIIVMNKGVIVERGTAEQVFNRPKDPYTKLLLGAAPSLLHPDLGE